MNNGKCPIFRVIVGHRHLGIAQSKNGALVMVTKSNLSDYIICYHACWQHTESHISLVCSLVYCKICSKCVKTLSKYAKMNLHVVISLYC